MESIPLLEVPRLMIQFICIPLIQQRLFEQRVFIHELLLPLAPVIPHHQEGKKGKVPKEKVFTAELKRGFLS